MTPQMMMMPALTMAQASLTFWQQALTTQAMMYRSFADMTRDTVRHGIEAGGSTTEYVAAKGADTTSEIASSWPAQNDAKTPV